MAEGRLVPDALVSAMLLEELAAVPDTGVLLDGFPRTLDQADLLDAALTDSGRRLDAALLLHVPDEHVVARIPAACNAPPATSTTPTTARPGAPASATTTAPGSSGATTTPRHRPPATALSTTAKPAP